MSKHAPAEPLAAVVGVRDDVSSITPYDRPPRDRLGTIASVHEDTSRSAACATITVMKLDVSNVDQTRSAVAGSSCGSLG